MFERLTFKQKGKGNIYKFDNMIENNESKEIGE
jgi:hypothetical protein